MIFRTRNIVTSCWLIIIACFSSCVAIKDYPKGKPFFYENTVKVNGEISSNDKSVLRERLTQQIEDTAQSQVKEGFYFFKPGWPVATRYIKNPPAYDSNAVISSVQNMRNLLMAQGFFRGNVTWSNPPVFKYEKDSMRIKTFVTYTADLGKPFRFNELKYNFRDSSLAQIIAENKKNSFIRKKDIFTKAAINSESDRLINLFRSHGYYKINREVMYNVIDTFPADLLDPSLSEFELIQRQIESQKRIENPIVDVEMIQSDAFDSSRLKQFYVRSIVVLPDYRPDSVYLHDSVTRKPFKGLRVVYHDNIIHFSVLRRLIIDSAGRLYNQGWFNQSITNLNRLGVWQSINADAIEVSDTTIDGKRYGQLVLLFRLIPATKYAYALNLNASRNTGNSFGGVISQGALIGVSLEGSRSNRNFLKEGIQSTLNARAGVEFYKLDTIQTFELSVGQSFVFSKLTLWPFSKKDTIYESQKSFLNLSGTYTNRRDFFKLYQATANFGWEWRTKRHPNITYVVKPANVEYLFYPPSGKLDELIAQNPFLKYTFNSGLIFGPAATVFFNLPAKAKNINTTLKISAEESGYLDFIPGVIKSQRILPYVKFDVEYKRTITHKKSASVIRIYGGAGSAYGSDTNTNVILPLPKQFVAGGPNSMRAWRLRKLGLGTMPRADSTTDRLGDIQLEFNIEHRFNLFPIYGFMLEGAIFTDAGNVWVRSVRSAPNNDKRAVFSLNELYPSIAVASGIGLRLNFGQFALRLDWAYTVKDPQFGNKNAGWFPSENSFTARQALQFNVNYPF